MNAIQKVPLTMSFNQVSIIGQISSTPTFTDLPNGSRVANFSLTTKEKTLDREGNLRVRKDFHRITAFGRWARMLEELCGLGSHVAVDGKLVSRFYKADDGERKMFSEIEVNDLVII